MHFPNSGPGATIWSKCEIAKIPKPNTGPGAYFRKNPVPVSNWKLAEAEMLFPSAPVKPQLSSANISNGLVFEAREFFFSRRMHTCHLLCRGPKIKQTSDAIGLVNFWQGNWQFSTHFPHFDNGFQTGFYRTENGRRRRSNICFRWQGLLTMNGRIPNPCWVHVVPVLVFP